MARAALEWSLDQAAEESGVSRVTIHKFEKGGDAYKKTVEKLMNCFKNNGLEFIPENGGGEGVRFRK